MHNGVFATMEEVIEFYDNGGGKGKGLPVANQTLGEDKLLLSDSEKQALIFFMHTLTENITPDTPPSRLPDSKNKNWNNRVVGGLY
jgi:cytochrome c peroxidase